MERSKYILITIRAFLVATGVRSADYKTDIYHAYIGNDMKKWKNSIDLMSSQSDKTNDFILQLINFQYGYIAWCIGNNKKDEAEIYLEAAEKNISILEKKAYKLSYLNSYKSAFYGFKIGLNVFKAPFLGPKSIACALSAIEQDQANPYAYMQYANAQYYMPVAFGGSKKTAITYYLKAQKLMETTHEPQQDWNYLSLLAIIGKAYEETGNDNLAQFYYQKILKIEPNFLWVKNELYPKIKNKVK